MSGLPDQEHPLVFFTGGTALKSLSQYLAFRTSGTVHLVTPFDSGGSTAVLRSAFAMPAVGDMRNRLLALADPTRVTHSLLALCDTRLSKNGNSIELGRSLAALTQEMDPHWKGIETGAGQFLRACLNSFLQAMPADFDLRNASLGNLFMAGDYLSEGRSLYSVLSKFSRLFHIKGVILPIVDENLHLAAVLEDGSTIVGQHLFRHLHSPVRRLFLTVHEPRNGVQAHTVCRPLVATPALKRLRTSSLICYPMGSFYTSVVANLLPEGVGQCVSRQCCPKVFIPNTGEDPELTGLTVLEEVEVLLHTLGADCPEARPSDLLTHVCMDLRNGKYAGYTRQLEDWFSAKGIVLINRDIVLPDGMHHDPERTGDMLLDLCQQGCGQC